MKKLIITSIFLIMISTCFSQEFKQGGYMILATAEFVLKPNDATPNKSKFNCGLFLKDDSKNHITILYDHYVIDIIECSKSIQKDGYLVIEGKSAKEDMDRTLFISKDVFHKVEGSDLIIAMPRGNGSSDMFWVKYLGNIESTTDKSRK